MAQRWHHNHYDRMKQKTNPQPRHISSDFIKTITIHYLHRDLIKHMLWECYIIWDIMSFYLIRSKSKLRYVTHGMFLRIIVTKFSWKQNVLCGGKQLEDNTY